MKIILCFIILCLATGCSKTNTLIPVNTGQNEQKNNSVKPVKEIKILVPWDIFYIKKPVITGFF